MRKIALPCLTALVCVSLVLGRASGDNGFGTVPSGAIVMWSGTVAAIPASWQLCDGTNGTPDLRDRFVKCVATAAEDPGSTGGSATASYTPAGTNGTVSFTPVGAIAWPAGAPTAANESAHTHSVTAAGTNGTVSFTPVGTIAWPAGVPTFTGSALGTHTHTYTDVVNHTHTIQMQGSATPATTGTHICNSTATGGSSRTSVSPDATNNPAGGVATGTTAATGAGTPAGTVAWPAGVPALTGTSGTVSAETFTGSAVTSGAGSTHTHTLSWPAGVPTLTGTSGTVSAETFTGTGASIATEPAYYKLAFIMRVH